MKYKAHPYADTYPMMSASELEALAEDIKTNGLEHAIIVYQGMILDGRNRYAACEKAGVKPNVVEFDGDEARALAKVRSLNDHRREMTPGKWALVGARQWLLNDPGKKAAKTVTDGNGSLLGSRALQKHFRVSPRDLQRARELLTEATDLVEHIDAGSITLAAAYEELQERRKIAEQRTKDMLRIAQYREAVERGDMSFEQAMDLRVKEEREQQENEQIEASARRLWLEGVTEVLEWLEAHVVPCKDSEFPWFFREDSPGMFDHDITAERFLQAEKSLERARTLGFGETHGRKKVPRRHS